MPGRGSAMGRGPPQARPRRPGRRSPVPAAWARGKRVDRCQTAPHRSQRSARRCRAGLVLAGSLDLPPHFRTRPREWVCRA
eukprot:8833058-Alexandrium_andersonii.AAC.1